MTLEGEGLTWRRYTTQNTLTFMTRGQQETVRISFTRVAWYETCSDTRVQVVVKRYHPLLKPYSCFAKCDMLRVTHCVLLLSSA